MEEEHEQETDVQVHPEPEPEVKKAPEVPAPPKEAERQLSKKERKKKELAELEALLADFGVAPKENNGQEDSQGIFVFNSDLFNPTSNATVLFCVTIFLSFFPC